MTNEDENQAIANEIGEVLLSKQPPTFDHALDIFAYHIGEIMTARYHVKVYFYGDVIGEYRFKLDGNPRDPNDPEASPHPGDTAFNVEGCPIGNRCAARNDYTKRCADVLRRIPEKD
jgi:hypothetical protein